MHLEPNLVPEQPEVFYSSTHHSPDGVIQLKTGSAQEGWLQWSYENWYFRLDISRCSTSKIITICYHLVDAKWSTWGDWTACTEPCEGNGTRNGTRSCISEQQFGGRACEDDPRMIKEECNREVPCPGKKKCHRVSGYRMIWNLRV